MASCTLNAVGVRKEGDCENERNHRNRELFKAVIREAYGVEDVMIGHHLYYENCQTGNDGSPYHHPQEIPSADALIFNHDVARKLWGGEHYLAVLRRLASEPIETRDELFSHFFYNRPKLTVVGYGGNEELTFDAV